MEHYWYSYVHNFLFGGDFLRCAFVLYWVPNRKVELAYKQFVLSTYSTQFSSSQTPIRRDTSAHQDSMSIHPCHPSAIHEHEVGKGKGVWTTAA